MRPGDVIEVEWEDHAFRAGEDNGLGIAYERSIGYFVSEDDSVIRIAQTLDTDDRTTQAKPNEVLVIDKRMLKRKRRVR